MYEPHWLWFQTFAMRFHRATNSCIEWHSGDSSSVVCGLPNPPPTYFSHPSNRNSSPVTAVTLLNWSWHSLAAFVASLLYKNTPEVFCLSDWRSYCCQGLAVSTVWNIPQMSLQALVYASFSWINCIAPEFRGYIICWSEWKESKKHTKPKWLCLAADNIKGL